MANIPCEKIDILSPVIINCNISLATLIIQARVRVKIELKI